MSDNFAATARRLAGLTPLILGWTPDQFWSATPEELTGILTLLDEHGPASKSPNPPDAAHIAAMKTQHPDRKPK